MKLGLALSGGGIRGIAHAGVLKALEENNIKIDAIGGTSSGSIIATLYAMGYSPYYIYILFKKYAKDLVNQNSISKVTSIGNFMANKKGNFQGFYTGEEIENGFNNIALRKGVKKISDIKMPIVIPTVDVQDSKKYIITNKIPEKSSPNTEYINNIDIGKAIKEVVDYLNGNYTKEEMIEKIKMETRRYAKRQLTWFRKNKQTIWLEGTNDIQNNINIILEGIDIGRKNQRKEKK